MWISKIELTAFKSYQHQEFVFPMPTGEKNIVIIGGLNGYGKTSILEALYLCLFGKDAISHLARAGLKTGDIAGYPTFLERAFNGEAKRDKHDTMTVRLVISLSNTRAFEITRKWFFRPNGNWSSDEETTVREIIRGVPDIPRADGKDNFHLADLLDEILVPAHVAPFFFFDGEEVKKLADQSRIEQVKQGLEGLLGVVLLRSLSSRLRNFENMRRQSVTTVDEQQVGKVHDEMMSAEKEVLELRASLNSVREKREQLKGQFESLVERLTSVGGGGANQATFKDAVEAREQLKNQLRASRISLETLIAEKLPFQLISKDVRSELKKQLNAEAELLRWEAEKRSLEPRKKEFDKAFFNQADPEFEPKLTEEQTEVIEKRLSNAWACLFFPPPENCAQNIMHVYLGESERGELISFVDKLSLKSIEISHLIREQHNIQSQIEDQNRRIAKLEGIENDGTLAAMRRELKNVQDQQNTLDDISRDDERRLLALESENINLKATYEREKKKLDDSSPARALLDKSERVRAVIDDVIPALFPLKVKALAASMTKVYKQIAHKDQISKISISDDGTTTIIGKSGQPILFDRSAGENQIFATALIAGLANVSGVPAPLVVDTPLGRLDSKHRKNILAFWTSDKSRQVILLSQDEEISPAFLKMISPSVSKTYLLEHEDVGDGIGRTSAKENAYFGAIK